MHAAGLWLTILVAGLGGCASAPAAAPAPEPAAIRVERRDCEPSLALERRPMETRADSLTVMAGGDIIFGRYLKGVLRFAGGADPFQHIRPMFLSADVAFLNLETPVTDFLPVLRKNPFGFDLKFRAPSDRVSALVDAGLDLVSTANNHAEDAGPTGIADTIRHLSAAGIATVGTSVDGDPLAPVTLVRGGVRIGIIGATSKRNLGHPAPGQRVPVAFLTMDEMLAQLPGRVRALREAGDHDMVWVSLHWGSGGERPVGKRYQTIARALIDAGADLVLGHHAHILQAVEVYGDGFIVYGMGNLIFDMKDLYGRETALFELAMARGTDARWRVNELTIHPLLIADPSSPPAPVTGAAARAILDPVRRLTRGTHQTPIEYEGDALVWRRGAAAAAAQ